MSFSLCFACLCAYDVFAFVLGIYQIEQRESGVFCQDQFLFLHDDSLLGCAVVLVLVGRVTDDEHW